MSNSCARAVVLGIAALYDIADEAGKGPIKPSLELRALLALMYQASRRDREPFDAFWKAVIDPGVDGQNESTRNYIRATAARIQIAGIARCFGMKPQSTEYNDFIEELRKKQRLAVDPDFRSRKHVVDTLKRIKHVPRGMTLDEAALFAEMGWAERPR